MSDTPRTDAFHDQWDSYNYPMEAIEFARSLERELNASKDHDRIANILSAVTDTPETDAFLTAENCRRDNPVAFDWLVGFARSLERKAANAYKGYQACNDDLIKCDTEVMRWFKAASPYATPGSLERGMSRLRLALRNLMKESAAMMALCEPQLREVAGNTNVAVLLKRIVEAGEVLAPENTETCLCLSFPHACPVHRRGGPIDSTVKPSAWD